MTDWNVGKQGRLQNLPLSVNMSLTQKQLNTVKAYSFKTGLFSNSAAKTMRLFSGHILPRNASNFTSSHLDLKKISQGETPELLFTVVGIGTRKGRGGD